MICVLTHGVLASTLSKIMPRLQSFAVFMNIALIFSTIVALPIGMGARRNDGHFIFAEVENLTTWPTGWTCTCQSHIHKPMSFAPPSLLLLLHPVPFTAPHSTF